MQTKDGVRGLELLGLALASLTVLGSQIAMTRILSLKYASNQTFLVVSFAVLGLAVGAAVTHRWCEGGRPARSLPAAGMALFAAALALVTGSFYLNLSAMQQIVLVPLPFVGIGVAIAAIFAQRSAHAGFYYAVDLAGAALGAFGAAPLLDRVPAPTALVVFVLLAIVAAAVFAPHLRGAGRLVPVVALLVVVGGMVGTQFSPQRWAQIPIYPDRIKDLLMYVTQARQTELDSTRIPFVERSQWSAFGRTDLLNDVARRGRKVLFVDGAAGSPMFPGIDDMPERGRVFFQNAFGPSVALRLTPPERKRTALAIGAGGGRDVLACQIAGVEKITAVELNPDLVSIVREEAAFNGGIYTDADDVEVVVEEGRHHLRSADAAWDVVLLSIPVTKRGEGYGGFALSESYLFTRESMGEYLDHVSDGGQLLIVCHTRQEVGRLINTYLAAVAERGVDAQTAMQRVGVFGDMLITLIITPDDRPPVYWQRLAGQATRLNLARPEQRFYFIPDGTGGTGSKPLVDVATGATPQVVFPRMSTTTFEPDMSAVTDDRPFFYFFTETLPPIVTTVLVGSGLVLVIMVVWGVIGAPAASAGAGSGAAGSGEVVLWRLAVAGLGIAFMLVEIPLIQRFVFWFGRPTLALGLLLGMLLLATGIGAVLAGALVRGSLARTWPIVAALGVLVMLAFLPAQRLVFDGATGVFADALVRSLVITLPFGLLMGVPFPMLLTAAGKRPGVSVAWLWGLNGVGSVLGSAGAVAIAMMFGYSWAMILAGAVYLATAVVFLALVRSGRRDVTATA
jgi:hypothetical protein